MPGILDHIAFLSQQVGPRPAGTEEEQQAALYITEQLQQEAGLSAVIEDFNSESSESLVYAISAFATIAFTVLALFIPVMAIPSLVITALAAVAYGLEAFNKPLLAAVRARGVSQNVVAKYEPGFSAESGGGRRRKIVLVANYDSGKVRPELNPFMVGILPILQKISLGAMIFVPALLLVRFFFFLHAEGPTAIVLNTLTVVALVFVALPVIFAAAHKLSAYNEGANSNASGVAALLEIARTIGQGSVRSTNTGEEGETFIHGEEAARSAGLVPEGAQLVYEASQVRGPDIPPQTEEDRLSAAKNAIAAMTGAVVSPSEPASLADNLVQIREESFPEPSYEEIREIRVDTKDAFSSPVFEEGEESALLEESEKEEKEEQEKLIQPKSSSSDVPEWFKKAQEKANKKEDKKPADIQRSRYADALDAAVAESSSHFKQAGKVMTSDVEDRLQKMRKEIMETNAPHADRSSFEVEQNKESASVLEARQEEAPQQQSQEANLGSTTAMPPINISELGEFRGQDDKSTDSVIEEASEVAPEADLVKKPIVLPDIGLTDSRMAPLSKTGKQQRAPLAVSDEDGDSQNTAKSLLNMLPAIDLTANDEDEISSEDQEKEKPNLKETLPSLSGVINKKETKAGLDEKEPSETSAVVTAGVTGVFSPVGEELLENVAPEDMYVDDVDDSAYEGALTETGAFAGPGYVDMPKSRARKIFGKFGRKKKSEEAAVSPQEWLEVDDDFDARNVGAARGGWESFQEPEAPEETDRYYNDNTAWDDDEWEGGAFSRLRHQKESDVFEEEVFEEAEEPREPKRAPQNYQQSELQHIQNFRHSDFNTEIWFVAVGAELAGNGGMKAFISEHEQELRGSIIIDISSLGAGELHFAEREGMYRAKKISSRMKRFIGKASQSTGVLVEPTSLQWKNSAASTALNRGFQAMSIFGMKDGKPAYFGQGDDVLENIEEETLQMNVGFIMELLRNI